MKVAIAGSRSLNFDIPEECIPQDTSLIISGGAKGIDRKARSYAYSHNIKIIEILPEYDLYGKAAPLKRNDVIISLADLVIVFWDGKSRGSNYVINKCRNLNKPLRIYVYDNERGLRQIDEHVNEQLKMTQAAEI